MSPINKRRALLHDAVGAPGSYASVSAQKPLTADHLQDRSTLSHRRQLKAVKTIRSKIIHSGHELNYDRDNVPHTFTHSSRRAQFSYDMNAPTMISDSKP